MTLDRGWPHEPDGLTPAQISVLPTENYETFGALYLECT